MKKKDMQEQINELFRRTDTCVLVRRIDELERHRNVDCRALERVEGKITVLGQEVGFQGRGVSYVAAPEISVSQKIDAICEHLGLEIVKKTREEKIVCRWRSPKKSGKPREEK